MVPVSPFDDFALRHNALAPPDALIPFDGSPPPRRFNPPIFLRHVQL